MDLWQEFHSRRHEHIQRDARHKTIFKYMFMEEGYQIAWYQKINGLGWLIGKGCLIQSKKKK